MKVKLNGNDFYEVSTQFGVTDFIHQTPHSGIDLVMETGTQLFSPVDGVVSKVVDYGSENLGKGIFIKTDSGENVIMGHLSDIKAKVGDTIHQGDLVALSGNTGHSTGSHLHLGLKGVDGSFSDPAPLLGGIGLQHAQSSSDVGIVDKFNNTWDFLGEVKEHGLIHAVYGKSPFQLLVDFFKELGHDILHFVLNNGDLFFLMPAIGLMFATFFIGRNNWTKYIIPLWFVYFVTKVLGGLLL